MLVPGETLIRGACRFFRAHKLAMMLAVVFLSVGMAASAILSGAVKQLSDRVPSGMREGHYLTIAESSVAGAARPVSWEAFGRLRDLLRDYELAGYGAPVSARIRADGKDLPVRLSAVSGDFFSTFSSPLLAGAGLGKSQETSNGVRAVVIGAELARELYGSPAAAVDRSAGISGLKFRIAGVAAEGFQGAFGEGCNVWTSPDSVVPLYIQALSSGVMSRSAEPTGIWRKPPVFYVLSRRPLHSPDASARLAALLRDEHRTSVKWAVHAGITNDPARDRRLRVWAVSALLLCVSLTLAGVLCFAGLLMATAPVQAEELRLKRILGAGSIRVLIELVAGPVSAALLALAGSSLLGGIALATIRQRAGNVPWIPPGRDVMWGLIYQMPLTLGLAFAVGLMPALGSLGGSSTAALPRGYSGTPWRRRAMDAIAVAQVVVCIGVSICSWAVSRSGFAVIRARPGYESTGRTVVVFDVGLGGSYAYHTDSRKPFPLATLSNSLLSGLAAAPGTRSIALGTGAPLQAAARSIRLRRLENDADTGTSVAWFAVTPAFFEVLGTPFVSGTGFQSKDLIGDPQEIVINQEAERQFWPNGALGRAAKLENTETGLIFLVTIVGIVGNQLLEDPSASATPAVYLPLRGNAFAGSLPLYVIANTPQPPFVLEGVVRKVISSQLPQLDVRNSYRVVDRFDAMRQEERWRTGLITMAALLEAMLAYAGLYSSLTYSFSVGRRDLAIRVCCGANTGNILWLAAVKTGRLMAIGGALSFALWPLLRRVIGDGWVGQASWSSSEALGVTVLCLLIAASGAAAPSLDAVRRLGRPAEILRAD